MGSAPFIFARTGKRTDVGKPVQEPLEVPGYRTDLGLLQHDLR